MVRARLHLICGNCGCNDDWSLKISQVLDDEIEGKMNTTAHFACGNCSTLHFLDEYIENARNQDGGNGNENAS